MPFAVGDEVTSIGDSSRVGVVRALGPRQGGIQYYSVFWGGLAGTRIVPEIDLRSHTAVLTPTQALVNGIISGYSDFQRTLIIHRLSRERPLRNNIFAFNASRTQFFPFQFKPLIKLLDSGLGRLLICDEVGLGKTIETGLILLEERARREIQTALIVCPSGLQAKWEMELRTRFDERFTILDAKGFARFLDEYAVSPDRVRINGIVSLESIRRAPVLRRLEELELELDFLVFDEAHWLRNASNGRSAAEALGATAGTFLLLTATPVHLGEENLFSLLNLLDPEEFPDFPTAAERFRQNEPIVHAQRLMTAGRAGAAKALDVLRPAVTGGWVSSHPLLPRTIAALEKLSESHDEHLARGLVVDVQRSLAGLNLLGHIFTRTRKREVKIKVPLRRPTALTVEMTDPERLLYHGVLQLVAAHRKARGGSSISMAWALGTLQRRLASSIHAMAHFYREQQGFTSGDHGDEELAGEYEPGTEVEELRGAVRSLVASWSVSSPDSKYAALHHVVLQGTEGSSSGKVLVFAFFKETLRYLSRRLSSDGISHALIDGDVDIAEREARIAMFRDDPGCRVLLSSRVGSEGLDFQFCDKLVNYDLPWNPMEVEQRIGRLDRIGQKADRIVIVNLWTKDTIEERILQRLYDRIGIFERSIGALDGVLGSVLSDLERLLVSTDLSESEQAGEAERIARVVESERRHVEELEQQSGSFIGVDEYFEQEVAGIQRHRRYVTGEQLLRFLEEFIRVRAPATRLSYHVSTRKGTIHPDKVLQDLIRDNPKRSDLIQFLGAGPAGVAFTMSADVAFENRQLEFINVLHPLIDVIRGSYGNDATPHVAAHHICLETDSLPAGNYLFGVFKVMVSGVREASLLETVVVDEDLKEVGDATTAEGLLGEMIERGEEPPGGPVTLEPMFAQDARDRLQEVFFTRLPTIRSRLEDANLSLVDRKIASVKFHFERQLRALRARLNTQMSAGQPERVLRLVRGQIAKREGELETHLRQLEAQRQIGVEHVEAAAGILEVQALVNPE